MVILKLTKIRYASLYTHIHTSNYNVLRIKLVRNNSVLNYITLTV